MQQPGDAAHQIGLEMMQAVVGISDFPEQFQQLHAFVVVEGVLDFPRVGKKLTGSIGLFLCLLDQRLRCGGGEGEALRQQLRNAPALALIRTLIDTRHLDQQSGRRQSKPLLTVGYLRFAPAAYE